MNTIYLRATTKALLTTSIKKVFKAYAGEVEYWSDLGAVHYIGDIPTIEYNETGEVVNTTSSGYVHANVYPCIELPTFTTQIPAPANPYNRLAV